MYLFIFTIDYKPAKSHLYIINLFVERIQKNITMKLTPEVFT